MKKNIPFYTAPKHTQRKWWEDKGKQEDIQGASSYLKSCELYNKEYDLTYFLFQLRNSKTKKIEKNFNDSHGRRESHLDMYGQTNIKCRERKIRDDETREKEKKDVHICVQ